MHDLELLVVSHDRYFPAMMFRLSLLVPVQPLRCTIMLKHGRLHSRRLHVLKCWQGPRHHPYDILSHLGLDLWRNSLIHSITVLDVRLQGLESEYDRLLAENDNLKRKLARFDGQFAAGSKKGE